MARTFFLVYDNITGAILRQGTVSRVDDVSTQIHKDNETVVEISERLNESRFKRINLTTGEVEEIPGARQGAADEAAAAIQRALDNERRLQTLRDLKADLASRIDAKVEAILSYLVRED